MHSIKQIVNCELKIYRACPERSRRGFTLIELLVSVAILLLILGAAVSVEVNSIKSANRNEHSLQATNLAQQQLNLVKTVRDNNIKDDVNNPFADFDTTQIIKLVTPTVIGDPYQLTSLLPLATGSGDSATDGKNFIIDGRDYYVKINVSDACDLGAPGCGP